MSGRLSRDLPHVMHETIDNEVVVVNLTSGVYYSFDGVGVCVWDWIDGSRTIEDIVKNATEHFDGNREHIASSVRGFLEKLLEENLVVLGSAESGGMGEVSERTVASEVGKVVSRVFAEPILQKYTDMEALLLADPIHEVDESAGWPHQK